jgi:hypothetical protein
VDEVQLLDDDVPPQLFEFVDSDDEGSEVSVHSGTHLNSWVRSSCLSKGSGVVCIAGILRSNIVRGPQAPAAQSQEKAKNAFCSVQRQLPCDYVFGTCLDTTCVKTKHGLTFFSPCK